MLCLCVRLRSKIFVWLLIIITSIGSKIKYSKYYTKIIHIMFMYYFCVIYVIVILCNICFPPTLPIVPYRGRIYWCSTLFSTRWSFYLANLIIKLWMCCELRIRLPSETSSCVTIVLPLGITPMTPYTHQCLRHIRPQI